MQSFLLPPKPFRSVSTLACLLLCASAAVRAAEETFSARPVVTTPAAPARIAPTDPVPPDAKRLVLRVGEIKQVFPASGESAVPRKSFYVPIEGTSVVQLIIEEKASRTTYFLRGVAPGKTVGGVVERAWLDRDGFFPRNPADEARIQQAVKSTPWLITVQGASK